MNVSLVLLGSGKMMLPFFLLYFSDLDIALKLRGHFRLNTTLNKGYWQVWSWIWCSIVYFWSLSVQILKGNATMR